MNKIQRMGFVVLGTVALSTAAWAVDGPWRSFLGADCVGFMGAPIKYYFTMLINDTTSSQGVVCPVVAGDLTGDGVHEDAIITVFDRHSSQDVSCTFSSLNADGSGGYSVSKSTSGFSSSATNLDFGYVVTGPYSGISCTIPPAQNGQVSGVASYKAHR